MDATARLHAVIRGSVQGVGFRYFALETAKSLALTGWVRNRWDGSVEVVAEGPRPALESLAASLAQGPRGARVEGVESDWQEASGELAGFRIRFL